MSLGDKFEVVSVLDPAIDTARMPPAQMTEYVRTRDIRIIRPFLKAGPQAPTIYHMREIPRSVMRSYVAYGITDEERATRAFLAGLVRIENLYQSDETSIPSFDPPPDKDRSGVADERILERVWPQEVEEIGRVVYQHSFLHPRMKQPFLLQRTCHELLVDRPFLTAVASPSLPASSSDAASPAASPPLVPTALEPVSTGAPFVSPTDATAQETPNATAAG